MMKFVKAGLDSEENERKKQEKKKERKNVRLD